MNDNLPEIEKLIRRIAYNEQLIKKVQRVRSRIRGLTDDITSPHIWHSDESLGLLILEFQALNRHFTEMIDEIDKNLCTCDPPTFSSERSAVCPTCGKTTRVVKPSEL